MVKFKNSFRIALLKIGRLLVIILFYSYTKLIGILNVNYYFSILLEIKQHNTDNNCK